MTFTKRERFSFVYSLAVAAIVFPVPFLLFYIIVMLGTTLALRVIGLHGDVAVWVPTVIAAVSAYILSRSIFRKMRRRAIVHDGRYCGNCDYDLTGNVSGICPECGTPIEGAEGKAEQ